MKRNIEVYLTFPLSSKLPNMAMMRKTKRAAMSAAAEVVKYGTMDMVIVPAILDESRADHLLISRRKRGKAKKTKR